MAFCFTKPVLKSSELGQYLEPDEIPSTQTSQDWDAGHALRPVSLKESLTNKKCSICLSHLTFLPTLENQRSPLYQLTVVLRQDHRWCTSGSKFQGLIKYLISMMGGGVHILNFLQEALALLLTNLKKSIKMVSWIVFYHYALFYQLTFSVDSKWVYLIIY